MATKADHGNMPTDAFITDSLEHSQLACCKIASE